MLPTCDHETIDDGNNDGLFVCKKCGMTMQPENDPLRLLKLQKLREAIKKCNSRAWFSENENITFEKMQARLSQILQITREAIAETS